MRSNLRINLFLKIACDDNKSFQQKYTEAIAKFEQDGNVHDFDEVIYTEILDFIQMKLDSITDSIEKENLTAEYLIMASCGQQYHAGHDSGNQQKTN